MEAVDLVAVVAVDGPAVEAPHLDSDAVGRVGPAFVAGGEPGDVPYLLAVDVRDRPPGILEDHEGVRQPVKDVRGARGLSVALGAGAVEPSVGTGGRGDRNPQTGHRGGVDLVGDRV